MLKGLGGVSGLEEKPCDVDAERHILGGVRYCSQQTLQ
jgi:hypothetical protein